MPTLPTPPIFLSYRTDGGEPYARHLRRELEQYFGKGTVFQDYESIRTGAEWAQVIPQAVREARCWQSGTHSWRLTKKNARNPSRSLSTSADGNTPTPSAQKSQK